VWASLAAWVLAVGATLLAAGLAASVPGDVPVLHGLPQIVAWVSAALVATGLVTGGQRMAPLAVAILTVAAAAAVADEGGPVDATAIGIGAAGWLCLELTASSLEARLPRRRAVGTVLRRIGGVVGVPVAGALVGSAAPDGGAGEPGHQPDEGDGGEHAGGPEHSPLERDVGGDGQRREPDERAGRRRAALRGHGGVGPAFTSRRERR
jgi:hypothetical protein